MSGVAVVLSGGEVDRMNPPEVRAAMDAYLREVDTRYGLHYQLWSGQPTPHIHQQLWPEVAAILGERQPRPLILVGHSYGGAAAVRLARALQQPVDLLVIIDAVEPAALSGSDPSLIPDHVAAVVNLVVVPPPNPAALLLAFPHGRYAFRADGSLRGIVNLGLRLPTLGVIAHRDAFLLAATPTKTSLLADLTQVVVEGDPIDVRSQVEAWRDRMAIEVIAEEESRLLSQIPATRAEGVA